MWEQNSKLSIIGTKWLKGPDESEGEDPGGLRVLSVIVFKYSLNYKLQKVSESYLSLIVNKTDFT